MNPFMIFLLFVFVIVLIYFFLIRPWQLTWGATEEEVSQILLGDDLVAKPHFVATRAVTIQASPDEIWKWILQIGSGRAGWYSLDWIDNGNVPSSKEILSQYQKMELDYFIPFTPDQKNGMWVKEFKTPETILWWDQKGKGTWGWFLQQMDGGETRLITRLRTQYDFHFPWVLYYLIYDFGDLVMMRKCMLGIKERAEASAGK